MLVPRELRSNRHGYSVEYFWLLDPRSSPENPYTRSVCCVISRKKLPRQILGYQLPPPQFTEFAFYNLDCCSASDLQPFLTFQRRSIGSLPYLLKTLIRYIQDSR